MDIFLGSDLTTFGLYVEQWSRSFLLTSKRCNLLYVFLNRHNVFRSIGCEMFHEALAHVFIHFSHRLNEVLDLFSPCSCKFKKRFPLLTIWFLLKSFRTWGSRILSWKYLTLGRCFRVINPISRVTFMRMVMSIILCNHSVLCWCSRTSHPQRHRCCSQGHKRNVLLATRPCIQLRRFKFCLFSTLSLPPYLICTTFCLFRVDTRWFLKIDQHSSMR